MSTAGLVPHPHGRSRGRWEASLAWPSRTAHPRCRPADPARARRLRLAPSYPRSGPSSRGSGRSALAGAATRAAQRAARQAARHVPGPALPVVVPPPRRHAPAPGRKLARQAGRPGPAAAARRSSPAPGAAAPTILEPGPQPRPVPAGPPLTPYRHVPHPLRAQPRRPHPVRAWRHHLQDYRRTRPAPTQQVPSAPARPTRIGAAAAEYGFPFPSGKPPRRCVRGLPPLATAEHT